MFLRIKMLKIDKKKKKLSFIKSAKINALLFLVTNKVGKRDQELFIYLSIYLPVHLNLRRGLQMVFRYTKC